MAGLPFASSRNGSNAQLCSTTLPQLLPRNQCGKRSSQWWNSALLARACCCNFPVNNANDLFGTGCNLVVVDDHHDGEPAMVKFLKHIQHGSRTASRASTQPNRSRSTSCPTITRNTAAAASGCSHSISRCSCACRNSATTGSCRALAVASSARMCMSSLPRSASSPEISALCSRCCTPPENSLRNLWSGDGKGAATAASTCSRRCETWRSMIASISASLDPKWW